MNKPANSKTPKWYAIRKLSAVAAAALAINAASAAEVFIYGDIGESWWGDTISAADFVKEVNALDVDHLTVRINSYGGSVTDGIAIHNALKRHKATVVTVVDGLAASIASLIAMAGDEVQMASNAMLMIHAPWGYAAGNSAELRRYADMLDGWAEAMASSYVAKSGKDKADVLALLKDGEDHWYTAEEAKAEKFIDAITDSVPEALAMASAFDINRFRSAPDALKAWVKSVHPAAAAAQPLEPTMPDPVNQPAAAATTAANTTAATPAAPDAKAVLAADKSRREGIRAAFEPFAQREGVAALLRECEDNADLTVEAAGAKLLAHLGKDTQPVAGAHVAKVEDEADKRMKAMTATLLVRAGAPADKELRAVAMAGGFRSLTLLDMARASLARAGIRTEHMDKMGLVAAAFTQGTSDFPILLENTMHKALQQAYSLAPDTWSRFCKVGSVGDFRAHNRYRLGSIANLDAKTELNEFKNKKIPDGEKSSITAGTKGNIIGVSREAIINDDLDAFLGLATMFGRAARRTVEADVYATLALNSGAGPTMSDGKALFHVDHGNIVSGAGKAAAPTVESFDAMRLLMAQQKDPGGNDYLDLRPAIWLGPIGLGGDARVVNGAEYDPDTANKLQKPNKVRGLFRDIVDTPRLSGTAHYGFADVTEAPALEVVFLDGNDTPFLERQDGWRVDGTEFKVRLDYGVGGHDWRGAVKNPGA